MKSKLQNVLVFILGIILLPFILVGGIFYFLGTLIYAPFEKVKYQKSLFFAKYKMKFRRGITRTKNYKIYNEFSKDGGEVVFVDGNNIIDRYQFVRIHKNGKKLLILPYFFTDFKVAEGDALILLSGAPDFVSLKKFLHDNFGAFKDYYKIVDYEPHKGMNNYDIDDIHGKKFSLLISIRTKDFLRKVNDIINNI